MSGEKEALSRVVDALQAQITYLKEQQRHFESRALELESEAKALQQEKSVLLADVQRSETERALYQDCVELVTKEKEALAKEASRVCQENHGLIARVCELEGEQRRLEREAGRAGELQSKLEELWTKQQVLKMEADDLKRQGQDKDKRAALLSGRLRSYEAGLQALLDKAGDSEHKEGGVRDEQAAAGGRQQVDLMGRVAEYVGKLRDALHMKTEEAAELSERRVALQLDLDASSEDGQRYRDCLLALLHDMRGGADEQQQQHDTGGGGVADELQQEQDAKMPALELVTSARLALSLLRGRLEQVRSKGRQADAITFEACIRALLALPPQSEDEAMGSELLCRRLREHVQGLRRRADELTQTLEATRSSGAADRRRLQQEFLALRAQLEAWGRQGRELEAAAIELVQAGEGAAPPMMTTEGSSSGGPADGAQLAVKLRMLVSGLKRELERRGEEVEGARRDGQVCRRILEQEVRELKEEVQLLTGQAQAYEQALFPILGPAARQDPHSCHSRGGAELAARLGEYVEALRAQVSDKAGQLDELRREKAGERSDMLEGLSQARERASVYARLLRCLAEAARAALGLEGGPEEEDGGQGEEQGRLPAAEEVKVLSMKLKQWGGRAQAEAARVAEFTSKMDRQLKAKDAELAQTKDRLRWVGGARGLVRAREGGREGGEGRGGTDVARVAASCDVIHQGPSAGVGGRRCACRCCGGGGVGAAGQAGGAGVGVHGHGQLHGPHLRQAAADAAQGGRLQPHPLPT